jgi:hypothetical protein
MSQSNSIAEEIDKVRFLTANPNQQASKVKPKKASSAKKIRGGNWAERSAKIDKIEAQLNYEFET